MFTDAFLADAAVVFFAAWSIIICSLSVAPFAPDLLPSRATTRRSDSVLPQSD